MKRFVNSILLLKSLASLSTAVHPWTIFTIKNVPPKLARITINKIITFFIKGSNIIVGSSVTLLPNPSIKLYQLFPSDLLEQMRIKLEILHDLLGSESQYATVEAKNGRFCRFDL